MVEIGEFFFTMKLPLVVIYPVDYGTAFSSRSVSVMIWPLFSQFGELGIFFVNFENFFNSVECISAR